MKLANGSRGVVKDQPDWVNASLMAALWPEVDIFMPSIVDLYEEPSVESDTVQRSEQPGDQAKFYKQLHLATLGRFLPMISIFEMRTMVPSEDPDTQKEG